MQNRRSFLAGGAALALGRSVQGANERPTLALIGGRNQGRGVALRAIQAGAEIKAFCDLDPAILEKTGGDIAKAQGRAPGFEKDFRRVLDDKSIDAVVIATPDHWHARIAIMACQAGKDVYCEKPMTQSIRDGQMVRDAARKYNRVFQVGTQRRSSEAFRQAVEYVAAGKLGKVCEMKAWIHQVRPPLKQQPGAAPPPGVDYDVWLGPAPKRAFDANRFHYNWRFFWDYGNSEIGNQGIHVLDVAMWAIQKMKGVEHSLPDRVSATGGIYWLDDGKEVPDTQIVNFHYPDLLLSFELRSFAHDHQLHQGALRGQPTDFYTAFYGTDGTLMVTQSGSKVYFKDGSPGPEVKGVPETHERNFLECIKSREKPNSDVEIGRLSTTLCHLGNISYLLGRDVKFDAKTETFPGDAAANRMLTRAHREPYGVPSV